MDAKACIFYGWNQSVNVGNTTLPDGLTVVDDSSGDEFIAVADSVHEFDWDYGAQAIFPQQMSANEESGRYYLLMRDYLEDQFEYKDIDIGWYIICDYI
jgi:hypothetical protein